MHGYDLEGADRVTTVGASDITMRIWNELAAAGEQGLTRDEILNRVGPHINRGYARRRYLKQRQQAHQTSIANGFASDVPTWETTKIEPALSHVVTLTLGNMRRSRSAIQQPAGRYIAGRKPRHRDPTIIDMTGDRTRIHMNSVNALRILEPALKRFDTSAHAQMTVQEKVALRRLVELHKEMLRDATGSV